MMWAAADVPSLNVAWIVPPELAAVTTWLLVSR